MWAIMVVENDKWHTRSQEYDLEIAKSIAINLNHSRPIPNAAVVPWDSRIYLLDNGLLEQEIKLK